MAAATGPSRDRRGADLGACMIDVDGGIEDRADLANDLRKVESTDPRQRLE